MGRASDDLLGDIHGMVAREIKGMVQSENPFERVKGLQLALRMLKENNITATEANPEMKSLKSTVKEKLPTAEELDKLMRLTPEQL